MAFERREKNGVVWYTSDKIAAVHGFSTRIGGVSRGCFESLNLRFGAGDDRENVLNNYRALGDALGIDAESAAFTKQVHGAHVRIVEADEAVSPTAPAPCEADGLVTSVPALPLFCFTADCVPVLLYEPKARVAAAVHCGWRSSAADILGAAVGKMRSLGAEAGLISAAIGPAIGQCCFETGSDVPEAIEAWLGSVPEGVVIKGAAAGKFMVDLREANRVRLVSLGLDSNNIDVSALCTKCNPELFWSHRAAPDGRRGVQCAVIAV